PSWPRGDNTRRNVIIIGDSGGRVSRAAHHPHHRYHVRQSALLRHYASGLGGRAPSGPGDGGGPAVHGAGAALTVADGDIMGGAWGAGGRLICTGQTGSQSPIVDHTSFASPIHEGYCPRDTTSAADALLPNPRHLQQSAAASTRGRKIADSSRRRWRWQDRKKVTR
uniref:Alkaline phosphatase n=1 Tax=Macrostomum lignano TaxID=282301 RepID=A0A1I8FPV7_9PLAT